MHVWMMDCLLYVCNIILFVSCADACMDDGLLLVEADRTILHSAFIQSILFQTHLPCL